MPRKTATRTLAQISDINMTPLMDLTFLLLITFIITFPLVEQGLPVNLPRAKARELPQTQTLTLTLNANGRLFLDRTPITLSDLEVTLADRQRHHPELTVLVRADEALEYGKVIQLLEKLHACRVSRLALVTRSMEP